MVSTELLRYHGKDFGIMKRDKIRYFQVGVFDQTLVLKKIKRFGPLEFFVFIQANMVFILENAGFIQISIYQHRDKS